MQYKKEIIILHLRKTWPSGQYWVTLEKKVHLFPETNCFLFICGDWPADKCCLKFVSVAVGEVARTRYETLEDGLLWLMQEKSLWSLVSNMEQVA